MLPRASLSGASGSLSMACTEVILRGRSRSGGTSQQLFRRRALNCCGAPIQDLLVECRHRSLVPLLQSEEEGAASLGRKLRKANSGRVMAAVHPALWDRGVDRKERRVPPSSQAGTPGLASGLPSPEARAFCFWNISPLVPNTSTSLHDHAAENSLKVPAPSDRKRRHPGVEFCSSGGREYTVQ